MSNSKNLLLICSVFLFFSFASSSYLSISTTHECSALLLFKQNLSSINHTSTYCEYPYPVMMNWNTTDCCHWDGVTCDHSTGDVIGLDLSCGMLQGTLHPNTSLLDLPRLQKLNLAFNDFTGSQIPREIGRFSSTLTHLNISYSEFTGQVPAEITLLHKLVSLDLSRNDDDISLEPRAFINMLQNYTNLEQLSLYGVNISSVLPAHLNISSSSSLKLLNLQWTGLHGQLPHYIFNLQSLEKLDLSFNSLTGQIPSEITLLPKLVSLHLSLNDNLRMNPHIFNSLLQNSSLLRSLMLADVNIGLILPTYLNISSSLNFLVLMNTSLKGKLPDLMSTGLHGKLPCYIFNLQSLEKLYLSFNRLTGQIPREITLLPKLVSLDLSYMNGNLRMKPHIFNSLLQNSTLLSFLGLGDVNIGSVLPTYLNISSSLKSLYLRNTSLKGKLPDNVFNLQYLEELYLSVNTNLTGPLPRVNATIPLKRLSLRYTNLLLGEIPDSIGHFKSLIQLDLRACSLKGKLPANIFDLQYLEEVDLSYNYDLIVPLPRVNATIPLKYLDLSSTNLLLGEIPDSIGHFNSLTSLRLSDCSLTGPLPRFLFNLRHLTFLDLSYNNFSGDWELDTLLSSLTNLSYLDLSYSGLSIVATSNANHHVNPNVESLLLASCKIKVFPESLRSMRNLHRLDLSSNEIHGHIPHWAGEIGGSTLYYLNLSYNFITGLPQFQWYGLSYLFLQSNLIQGPFPPSICNMSDLQYLDMSNNRFDGVIPQCFGNITPSLEMINLGNNHFQGIIPIVYEKCGVLEWLILNGNQLDGEVPSSLSKCQSLKILDMGNNYLNGTFPSWLESLPDLQVLVLRSNSFHGRIVPSSTVRFPFQTLRVLDLSHNAFVGPLPTKFFQSFNAMKNVVRTSTEPEYLYMTVGIYYSIIVAVKGQERLFSKLFVGYIVVDLSSNTFEGEIPNIVGILNSLKVLNLSHNNLIGQIPHTLGNLGNIESLDLSWNQLTGEIPQSLADLTFLSSLNLSQNHLVGRIPQGKQFNTFQGDSFGSNPKLCGVPLPNKCEHPRQQQVGGDGDDVEHDSGLPWKVVMLGYGCGTLFGLLMGYLMLSTGRPKWFNAIADAAEHVILRMQTNRRS